MLVITVKDGESFWIGDSKVTRDGNRMVIDAPRELKILRDTLKNRKPKHAGNEKSSEEKNQ